MIGVRTPQSRPEQSSVEESPRKMGKSKNTTARLALLLAVVAVLPVVSAFPARAFAQGEKADDKKVDEEKEPEDRYLVIRGGVLHPSGDETVEGSSVLCKNGKIVAIGPHLDVPEGAEVIDADGHHLYPGLVGIETRSIVSSTDLFSLNMSLGLAAGLTTVVSGGTVYKLSYGELEGNRLGRTPFAVIRYTTRDPAGRRRLRGAFERMWKHQRDLEAYEIEKAKDPKAKKPDERWIRGDFQTAKRLMDGDTVALVRANTVQEIRPLTDLARKYDFKLVVQGAAEGYLCAGDLARAGASCIVTPRARLDVDSTVLRANGSSPENAKILHAHGVPVVVTPSRGGISLMGLGGRDLAHLPMEAAFAVRGGLEESAAIQSITTEPARMIGLAHRIGTIEVGKDADFAITDGDLLHYMSLVRWTIVNGRIAYDKEKDSLYNHIRPNGDADSPPPDDHWPRSLGEDW